MVGDRSLLAPRHGSAKARIVGIGLFDNVKRSIVAPVDASIDIPIVDKRTGQVISIVGNSTQIMDGETFEVFEVDIPEDLEGKDRLAPGVEVEYWRIMGRNKLVRVK